MAKKAKTESLEIRYVAVDDLKPWPANPRKHAEDIEAVKASIEHFGWTNPLLVQAGTARIIAGHGRLEAAKRAGISEVPVIELDMTDLNATAYTIADNRLAELSAWDADALGPIVLDLEAEGFDVALTGFDEDGLAEILPAEKPEIEDDEIPEPPSDPITKPGDLWVMGGHRLLCGDCRKADSWVGLLEGEPLNLVFTSPPYASQRKYDESSGFKPIHPDEYGAWWEPLQAIIAEHLAGDGSFFVNIKEHCEGLNRHLYVFDLVVAMVRDWGWHYAELYCWERPGIPGEVRRRFKSQFEHVFQFTRGEWKFRPEAVRHASSKVPKNGSPKMASRQGTGEDEQWEIAAGLAYPGNRLPRFAPEACGHGAAYPVGLPSFFMSAYTDKGDTLGEPFAGSGTNFIAAEQLSRRCYGIEISPTYCDVIVERWEALTGGKAKRG